MKNRVILALGFVMSISLSFSQRAKLSDYQEPYFIFDMNIGTRLGKMKSSPGFEVTPIGLNTSMGLTYMFNHRYGIRGGMQFNGVKSNNSSAREKARASIFSASAEGTCNIMEFFKPTKRTLGLTVHTGMGASTMLGRGVKNNDRKFIPNGDDMIHGIIGISPQIHLNPNLSLNFDFSFMLFFMSDSNVDFKSSHTRGMDKLMNASVGLVFRSKEMKQYHFFSRY